MKTCRELLEKLADASLYDPRKLSQLQEEAKEYLEAIDNGYEDK